jgi:hypothetical protein
MFLDNESTKERLDCQAGFSFYYLQLRLYFIFLLGLDLLYLFHFLTKIRFTFTTRNMFTIQVFSFLISIRFTFTTRNRLFSLQVCFIFWSEDADADAYAFDCYY